MKYRIEMKYFYGWDDAGWTDVTDDAEQPTHFQSAGGAQAALEEFLTEVMDAVRTGYMDRSPDRSDYRIARVIN